MAPNCSPGDGLDPFFMYTAGFFPMLLHHRPRASFVDLPHKVLFGTYLQVREMTWIQIKIYIYIVGISFFKRIGFYMEPGIWFYLCFVQWWC